MTEMLRRDELIALLNRFGSDEDEQVLEAARQTHARIAAAGLGWEDLLVADESAGESADESADEPADEPADEIGEAADGELEAVEDEAPEEEAPEEEAPEDEAPEDEAPEDEAPAEPAADKAESLALVGELLARSDISEELRAELDGYKADIAEGDFLAADLRYLRAVRQRLKK